MKIIEDKKLLIKIKPDMIIEIHNASDTINAPKIIRIQQILGKILFDGNGLSYTFEYPILKYIGIEKHKILSQDALTKITDDFVAKVMKFMKEICDNKKEICFEFEIKNLEIDERTVCDILNEK